MTSAVCAKGVTPVLLANNEFCVVSQALSYFPFQPENILVIVPAGCLYRSFCTDYYG